MNRSSFQTLENSWEDEGLHSPVSMSSFRLSLSTDPSLNSAWVGAPWLWLSPSTARQQRLENDQLVQVSSQYGQLAARIRLDARLAANQAGMRLAPSNLESVLSLLGGETNDAGNLLWTNLQVLLKAIT